MPAAVRRWHVVVAGAAAFVVGVAIFLALRAGNAEHPVAGIRPPPAAVVATTPEPAQRSSLDLPGKASAPASSSTLHRLDPHASDAAENAATAQWRNWRDAPPIDRARALDLLADKVAKEREEKADAQSVLARVKFERYPVNVALTGEASTGMQQFLSSLDPDLQQHLAIGSVECRGNVCQALVALNGFVNVSADNNVSIPQGPVDLRQMVDAMAGQPWWSQSGHEVESFAAEFRDGYALYQINFTRPAK